MSDSMLIELIPDESNFAALRGDDYGDTVLESTRGKTIKYTVTHKIAVHGHAILNEVKERASLVTFLVEASGPLERPIRNLKLDIWFEDGPSTSTTATRTRPRVIKTFPGSVGYKVECTVGSSKHNVGDELEVKAQGGVDGAKIGANAKHKDGQEIKRQLEFYTFVKGVKDYSDHKYAQHNLAHWEFDGEKGQGGKRDGGVPPVVEVAVLLMRSNDQPFHCKASLKIQVDWSHKAKDNLMTLMGFKTSRANAKDFDVTKNEQPKKKIDTETLEIYNNPDEKEIQALASIRMPEYYEKFKLKEVKDEDEDDGPAAAGPAEADGDKDEKAIEKDEKPDDPDEEDDGQVFEDAGENI